VPQRPPADPWGDARQRVRPGHGRFAATAAPAAVTVALLAPRSLAAGGPVPPATPEAATSLALTANSPSVLAYLLCNRALDVLPASRLGVFRNLITVSPLRSPSSPASPTSLPR
jgi:hypothetical protein